MSLYKISGNRFCYCNFVVYFSLLDIQAGVLIQFLGWKLVVRELEVARVGFDLVYKSSVVSIFRCNGLEERVFVDNSVGLFCAQRMHGER